MALSNTDRITQVMTALKDGLGPFVIREYRQVYGKKYLSEIDTTLRSGSYTLQLPPGTANTEQAVNAALLQVVDTHGWLNLMARRWNEVFETKLGRTGRAYVNELQDYRNAWAHQQPFTNDDAARTADTAVRLLRMISASEAAQAVEAVRDGLQRQRYKAEAQKSAKKPTAPLEELTTKPGLVPWRLVVEPHPDVASGRYLQAEFAADLALVKKGLAADEYKDPKEFFRRTYLTEGLVSLLVTGVKRLTAQVADPVVQLQTPFGGGKTHSMLALYHLVGGKVRLADIPGGDQISQQIGDVDLPEANRAVIVGLDFNPATGRSYKDATTHTLWGEIAYQLGGIEGYRMVESADLAAVNPGSDTLRQLLDRFGPCLVIMDELVAFGRTIYGVKENLPAGSFDTLMSFVQALTEAVKGSKDSMLLVSLPESETEVGGEGGRATLQILSKIIGRVESVWRPVTATESFEIVRRRLFSSQVDYARRDAVIAAFREMYRANPADFPYGVAESDYAERMKSAYPIHPELFDRLYQDWSTLDRFQRTRGVLQLMAEVIHALWLNNDHSLLIMPGTIPLDSAAVRNKMLGYLPENWSAILDVDIDGKDSRPAAIDSAVPTLGKYAASRRVARAIFVGSAPSGASHPVRGVEEVRVRLATVQPGEPTTAFGDALRRMSNQLTYLYSDGTRYWYDTRPTVNRIASDRAQSFAASSGHLIEAEIVHRLKRISVPRQVFAGAHVAPPDSASIVDEQTARVVVLPPDKPYNRRSNGQSAAIKAASDMLINRGSAQRLFQNMLVFIAPDEGDAAALYKAVAEYLAWQSIQAEEEQLNLDAQQRRQVQVNLDQIQRTVNDRLQETYSWLLVPAQPDETQAKIEWQALKISGEGDFYTRAARKLRQGEQLITEWSAQNLRIELDRMLWRDKPHLKIKTLWEYLTKFPYLPRLRDQDVLLAAIREGVSSPHSPFAYAPDGTDHGAYPSLIYGGSGGSLFFDAKSLLVKPEFAEAQIARWEAERKSDDNGDTVTIGDTDDTQDGGDEQARQQHVLRRYYGSVTLDPLRVNGDVDAVVQEIIQHLTGNPQAQVQIRLEIEGYLQSGFDEKTLRTLSENANTLGFDTSGFDES